MALLTPPKFFKLGELEAGTVLVENGFLQKEEKSERFGNRQFYFFDKADSQLKCLSGGSLAYIVDEYGLDKTTDVKITYNGMSKVENGKFAGKMSHQFKVESMEEEIETVASESVESNVDLNNLA